MSKKYFIFAIAAAFSLAVITSCNSKSSKSSNDTEESEDTEDAEDAEASVSIMHSADYLTQDLATFDLFGRVASVSYEMAGQYPVTIRFDGSGQLISVERTNHDGTVETAELTYNDKRQLEQIEWPDDPWVVMFVYSGRSKAPSQYISTNRYGNGATYTYTRDSSNAVTAMEREESVHFEEVDKSSPTFSFDEIDSHDNWLLYTEQQEDWSYSIRRTILYNDHISESSVLSKDKVTRFITDMYGRRAWGVWGVGRGSGSSRLVPGLSPPASSSH